MRLGEPGARLAQGRPRQARHRERPPASSTGPRSIWRELQRELLAGTYRPGGYVHFHVKDPKRRNISAACFRDRVVHHALCALIEPRFERLFIPDSYANRLGKGTHEAIDRLQDLARGHRYVLRADVVQHFAFIDHAMLRATLRRRSRSRT